MAETRIVHIRESILAENTTRAADVRQSLTDRGTYLVNIMASPGAGKTSLILQTMGSLRGGPRMAVIEADLDSTVDADKVIAAGFDAVQIETGGFCHADARMVEYALSELDSGRMDLIFLENVGNLICTAQHETGAHLNVAVLSVPEGDDKPLKYPIMFRSADAIIINKTDYIEIAEFDLEAATQRIRVLNPKAPVFAISCRTGAGCDAWVSWLESRRTGHFPPE